MEEKATFYLERLGLISFMTSDRSHYSVSTGLHKWSGVERIVYECFFRSRTLVSQR